LDHLRQFEIKPKRQSQYLDALEEAKTKGTQARPLACPCGREFFGLLQGSERCPFCTAVEALVEWFLERYKDPADGVPYAGREDGYQFTNGGPYDPDDVLLEHFDDESDEVRDEATNRLWAEGGNEWVGVDEY